MYPFSQGTGLDDGGWEPDCGNPSPDGRGDELRAGVGPDEGRDVAQHAKVRQDIEHVRRTRIARLSRVNSSSTRTWTFA